MAPGAPMALREALDNPPQLVFARPDLQSAASKVSNGERTLRDLLGGSRAGLLDGMRSIFSLCAATMAISVVLNLFWRKEKR